MNKEEQKYIRKNRIKTVCIEVILFTISYIPFFYFLLSKESVFPKINNNILFIFWLLLSGIAVYYSYILEIKFSKKVKNYIYSLFEFKNQYSKIEFENIQFKKTIESDFFYILSYNHNIRNIFCNRSDFQDKIEKYNINNRNVYIGTKNIEKNNFFNVSAYSVYYLDIFTKIDINKRFNIISIPKEEISFKQNTSNFEKRFKMTTKDSLKNEIKKFEKIEHKLSTEFYFKNFPKLERDIYLELNDSIKKELVFLLNEYKINFSISIKDNLLIIELGCHDLELLKKPEKINDLETLAFKLFNIFIELENQKP